MMKIIRTGFFLSVFSLILLNCKTTVQSAGILSVSYSNTYGKGGSTSITATKDSLQTTSWGRRAADFPKLNKKMNPKDWENLVSGIDISVLEKTQNGNRRCIFDGNDEIFRIATKGKEYEIINASVDSENYKQLENLRKKLENLADQNK